MNAVINPRAVIILIGLTLVDVIIGHLIGHTVLGWTTIIVLVCLFGGMQIMCIGIVGEYVGKIYLETKKRPRYIVEEKKLK